MEPNDAKAVFYRIEKDREITEHGLTTDAERRSNLNT